MWDAIATYLAKWQVTPFGVTGWAAAYLVWRERVEMSRDIREYLRADTLAKLEASTAMNAAASALSGLQQEVAVLRERIGGRQQ